MRWSIVIGLTGVFTLAVGSVSAQVMAKGNGTRNNPWIIHEVGEVAKEDTVTSQGTAPTGELLTGETKETDTFTFTPTVGKQATFTFLSDEPNDSSGAETEKVQLKKRVGNNLLFSGYYVTIISPTETPEPGMVAMIGSMAAFGGGLLLRRRRAR